MSEEPKPAGGTLSLEHLLRALELANDGIGPEPEVPEHQDLTQFLPKNIPSAIPSVEEDPEKTVLLYDPEDPGYMRSTREGGIAEQLAQMDEQAQGTPFFSSLPPSEGKKAIDTVRRRQVKRLEEDRDRILAELNRVTKEKK